MTAINLTAGQVHVVRTGGRRRGPIDNPTLNTLNNQEDEVEPHDGHGQQPEATGLARGMRLAFLIDQVQEEGWAFFQAARQRFHSRTSLGIQIQGLFIEVFLESGEALWRAMIYGHGGGSLQFKTSSWSQCPWYFLIF